MFLLDSEDDSSDDYEAEQNQLGSEDHNNDDTKAHNFVSLTFRDIESNIRLLNLKPRTNYTTNFISKRLDDKILAPFMEIDQQRLESELLARLISAKQKSNLAEEYAIINGNRNLSYLKRYTRNDLNDRPKNAKGCWNCIPPILKIIDSEYYYNSIKTLKNGRKDIDAETLKENMSSCLSGGTNPKIKRSKVMNQYYIPLGLKKKDKPDIVIDDLSETATVTFTSASSFSDFSRLKSGFNNKRPVHRHQNSKR